MASRKHHQSELDEVARLVARVKGEGAAAANAILKLRGMLKADHPKLVSGASEGLIECFKSLDADAISAIDTPAADEQNQAMSQYAAWLRSQVSAAIAFFLADIETSGSKTADTSLRCLMDLVVIDTLKATRQKDTYSFDNNLFERIVRALVSPTHDKEELLELFNERYMSHCDVKLYTMRNLSSYLSRRDSNSDQPKQKRAKADQAADAAELDAQHTLATNVYMILHVLELPDFESGQEDQEAAMEAADGEVEDEEEQQSKPSILCEECLELALRTEHPALKRSSHSKAFADCWLAFLRLNLPTDVFKDVLLNLDDRVMPNMPNPKLLIDFLTDSYSSGGIIAILSLSALFTLIGKHNLEYPDFFKQLYALFDEQVLHSKHRARFFTLAHFFLRSSHLSSALVASFIKRTSRLALAAPPSSGKLIVGFVYNLLRRHPACRPLVHRALNDDGEPPSVTGDPFFSDEADPSKTNALESSLWELDALSRHYFPEMSVAPGLLKTPAYRKLDVDLKKAAKLSLSSMIKTMLERKLPEEVPVNFSEPTSFFEGNAAFEETFSF